MTVRTMADIRRDHDLDRRTFMVAATAGAAMAMAAVAAPANAASAATAKFDLSRPEDARQVYRRLKYRSDEGILFWWIDGEYLADEQARLTPLYGMKFGSIQHYTPNADGGFTMRQLELGFRTDLNTGKLLGTFRNPLTNEIIDSPVTPLGPNRVRYSPDGVPSVPREIGGSLMDFTPHVQKPYVARDTVFLPYRASTTVHTPGFSDRIINDISLIYGPAAQVLDPGAKWVDAWVHGSDITTWPRWMKMGDRPGTLTLRGIGAKVRTIDEMPEEWLDLMQQFAPSILKDPLAALSRPQFQYKG